jgi:Fe-S cluster biogenesis protein NfuA
MEEVVRAVVEGLRPAFQANGADLDLKEVSEDAIRIEIVFGPGACRECVLPAEMIQPTFAQILEAQLGHPVKIVVEEAE